VSKSGARRITESISRIDRPIDDELDRYWARGLPTYAVFPYPVIERNLGSTIEKGFDAPESASTMQRVSRFALNWLDKFPREYANARLRPRDKLMAKAIKNLSLREL
jgi:glycosyl transferase family 25